MAKISSSRTNSRTKKANRSNSSATPSVNPSKKKSICLIRFTLPTSKKKFRIDSSVGINMTSQKTEDFLGHISSRTGAIETAAENFKSNKEGDFLFAFRWNDAGLHARVATAANAGLLNSAGTPVTNAAQVKEGILNMLKAGPNGAIDLGGHGDLFQFLSSVQMFSKLNELLGHHPYLRHFGGVSNIHINWPDVVSYLQVITITKASVAVATDFVQIFNA